MLSSLGDEPSQDSTEGGYGALYRWTKDALFGSRVSPSRKYKEFSQDDTNYNGSRGKKKSFFNESMRSTSSGEARSASFSGLDPMFYNRYDLLHDLSDDDDNVLPSSPHIEPIPLSTRIRSEPTDTFGARRRTRKKSFDDDFSIVAKSPSPDDPLISRLFDKKRDKEVKSCQIPGKFPTPARKRKESAAVDYTAEYLQILDQLDRNGKALSDMSRDIEARRVCNIKEEESYRTKYRQTRSELIKELKHSKTLYDNYYKLYGKYQQLKNLSEDAVQYQSQVSDLEKQLVEGAIEKEKQIHSLSRKLSGLELELLETRDAKKEQESRYEARILELESQLTSRQPLPSGVSSLSFSPSRSNYRDQSSFSDYNAAVDSQFFKNFH